MDACAVSDEQNKLRASVGSASTLSVCPFVETSASAWETCVAPVDLEHSNWSCIIYSWTWFSQICPPIILRHFLTTILELFYELVRFWCHLKLWLLLFVSFWTFALFCFYLLYCALGDFFFLWWFLRFCRTVSDFYTSWVLLFGFHNSLRSLLILQQVF